MKNILCYIGIILLLGLVLFPPILRITLPNKTEEGKNIARTNYILSCSNERFIINTTYELEKTTMIVMKKKFTQQEIDKRKKIDESIENLDEQLLDPDTKVVKYQDIVDIFNNIKDKTSITYEVGEDGEIVSIDFSIDSHNKLGIDKLTQKLGNQQQYYEKLDFSCTIK